MSADLQGTDRSGEPDPKPTDPAHQLLDRFRRSAPAGRRPRRRAVVDPDEQVWSGPGSDDRDPSRLSASLDQLIDTAGWRRPLDAASLAPRWRQIVGPVVAEHARPDRIAGGELTVVAESTAWATQIRLMSRRLLAAIAAEVGEGLVDRVRVVGPTAPDWRHGPLRIRGRGPRDTYG